MAAKHRHDTSTSGPQARRRWRVPALLTAAAATGTALTFGLATPSAEAAAASTDAYLGGLGVHTTQCPVTPSNVIYVQPNTTIKFHADLTGLGALGGRGGLLGLETAMTNPLNARQTVTVTTAANGAFPVTFGGQGTYNFTWTAKTGYIEVLGQRIPTGIIAAVTGAKLTWQGQVVVSTRAQNCKLAPQIPSVQVSPSLPVVGNLPGVNVPGVQVPGVDVPGSTANPTASGSPSTTAPATGTTTAPTAGSTGVTNPYDYEAPDCTGPCAVVPKGGGGGGSVGGASDVTLGDLGDAAAGGSSSGASGDGSGDAAAIAAGANSLGDGSDQLAVDRAFTDARTGSTSLPGLPTSLTIAAIAALAGASVLWFARRRLARG